MSTEWLLQDFLVLEPLEADACVNWCMKDSQL